MKIRLALSNSANVQTFCETELEELTLPKKILRYVLRLIAIAIGTAVCGVIPLLHFIVIPAGFIFFCYAAITGLKMSPKFDDTQGTCPSCNATFLIFKKSIASLPYEAICDRCQQKVTVSHAN